MFMLIALLMLASAFASDIESEILPNDLIHVINSNTSLWEAGTNFPPDTPLSFLKKLASLKGYNNDPNFEVPLVRYNNRDNVPNSFDASSAWPKCKTIKQIRDQGRCGSCWAFAVAEVMSDRHCISKNEQFIYSPEELVSCCSNCGFGCNGGYIIQAFKYWVSNGIPSGGDEGSNHGCRPYTAGSTGVTPKCIQRCVPGYSPSWTNDLKYGVEAYYVNANEEDMKNELVKKGPIVVGFDVYEDFFQYKRGVYTHTAGKLVGRHAVKIIGYGTENGVKYWLIANSWGERWGDGGFFKIKRGTNECNIESRPCAANPRT